MWAHPQTPMPHAFRRARRTKLWISLAVGIAAVFAIGAFAGGLFGNRNQLFDGYVEQLKRGKTCEERKEPIAKLRALGDKRAIKPLKRARYRMRGGIAGIGDKNTNACLRKEAEEAIEYLEGL